MKHQHQATVPKKTQCKLAIAVFLTLGFAAVEYIVGKLSNSLALIADAGHMITDSLGLFLALIAGMLSSRPANKKFTYGYGRIQMLAALINILLLSAVVIHILADAFFRLYNPVMVDIYQMAPVAALGLVINIAVFFVLHDKQATSNMKAAQLHVLGDMLGSIGALIGAGLIYLFGWHIIDPIISILICIILSKMILKLGRRVMYQATDGVPPHIDIKDVEAAILNSDPSLKSIHDIHIWQSCDKYISLTAHVETSALNSNWNNILYNIHDALQTYDIEHITIQPEFGGGYCDLETNTTQETTR